MQEKQGTQEITNILIALRYFTEHLSLKGKLESKTISKLFNKFSMIEDLDMEKVVIALWSATYLVKYNPLEGQLEPQTIDNLLYLYSRLKEHGNIYSDKLVKSTPLCTELSLTFSGLSFFKQKAERKTDLTSLDWVSPQLR